MSTRRDNRIAAMQFLYSWEINPSGDLDTDVRLFFKAQENPRDYYNFAEELIYGVIKKGEVLDSNINDNAQNWNFKRIAKVDLAILRLAIYELLYRPDIPPVVTINEAIDMGKLYSGLESKRFINGILDNIKKQLKRPFREPSV